MTEEDRLNWLAEKLPAVEGQQEKLYQSVNVAEAALDELLKDEQRKLRKQGLVMLLSNCIICHSLIRAVSLHHWRVRNQQGSLRQRSQSRKQKNCLVS